MSDSDLRYVPIRRGGTTYNERAIEIARAKSQGDKAHIIKEKKQKFRRFVTKCAFSGLAFATVIGLWAEYAATTSRVGEEIADTYIAQLGTIIDKYSEAELLALANQMLEKLDASNQKEDQAYAADIRSRLVRIEELKAKGMMQEVGWQWENIVALASNYNLFLAGYSFDKPIITKIGEEIVDKVKGLLS
jgi:hypothetical protein